MRTTPVLRSVAAALLTGGVLTGPLAPGALAATGPTHIATSGGSSDSSVRSAVVSGGDVNVRKHPTTKSPVVGRVSSRSHNPVLCSVLGERIGGDRTWYWLAGAGGWVSAAFADTGGQRG